MATFHNGIMGPFSGKVGTVVGYLWNGKPCMRAYKRHVANPRTEAQQEHRTMFKQEVQLAAKMRWAVKTTMTEMAREAGMTAYNLFVKVNQGAFGVEYPSALTGTSPKTGEELEVVDVTGSSPKTGEELRLAVDYSRLILSIGEIPQVELREVDWSADNVLTVRYGQGRGSSYDHVYLYVYVPELGTGFLSAPSYRRDKRLAVALPDEFAGCSAVVYLMVQSDGGGWSDSLYCGEVVLDENVSSLFTTPQSAVADSSPKQGCSQDGAGGVRGEDCDGSVFPTPPLRAPLPEGGDG